MPKILKICSIRSLFRQTLSQNYCVYRHIYKQYLPCSSSSHLSVVKKCNISFSTLSSPEDATEIEIKQLTNEFPEPKQTLSRLLNEAYILDPKKDLKPLVSYEKIVYGNQNEFLWKALLQVKWPESFKVEGIASKKADAENIAFLFACQKLKILGVLDSTNKPVLAKDESNLIDHTVKVAKGNLLNIFQRIWIRHGKKEYLPKFNTVPLEAACGGAKYWKSNLQLIYPENKVFEATATRLRDAENIASVKALQWLITQGVISKNQKLVLYSKEDETKLRELQQAPYSISIPKELQDKMQEVICELEKQKSLLSNADVFNDGTMEAPPAMYNVISEKVYKEPTMMELSERNMELFEKSKIIESSHDPELLEIKRIKSELPIQQKREEILKLIDANQVIVLSGETGCGKSTQVPQFILDHYTSQMKGAECNIIVTQPRRISALSIAERVAKERCEEVGQTVGYQIRLHRCRPSRDGAILYCTTGVLLRKLCSNPNLEGISHVIVDEVHERSIHIDFLLILLKNVLENNKSIKLILMSASFNTQLFSQYFNNAAVINVPGKNYPVKEYFFEDLERQFPGLTAVENKTPILNVDLLARVINYIDTTQPPGAILCFLPGWTDIRLVHSKLLENKEAASKLFICPIHSRLPPNEQKKIFCKPPGEKRKIVLATNIAETSITVSDVVYVVNSGLHKGTLLDAEAGIAALSVQWITKANVRQRRGRAGRLQPGICYHLFSRRTLMGMSEYPVAEILRVPLEKVILDSKLHCPEIKAEKFLSQAIQPPSAVSIQNGVADLQSLGILNDQEDLTDLGKIVVRFGTHPRLSIALIYSAFLGCIDPVLTICALLTLEKEPFLNTLDDKLQIKKVKKMFDNGLCSDHLSLYKIYDTWRSLNEVKDINEYTEKYLLDEQSLYMIKSLKGLFAEDLKDAGVVPNISSHSDKSSLWNVNSHHIPSILTALTVAFFPNVIRITQGDISHEKLVKDAIIYSAIKGHKAYIQKESVLCDEGELPSPWLVYFIAMKSEARRLAMVSSLSSVPGIGFLLLAGKDVSMQTIEDDKAVLLIDDYKRMNFSCTEREARLLLDWRACMQDIFKLYVRSIRKWNTEEHEFMLFCKTKFIQTMKELLEIPHVPFVKGHVYEFVDNTLVEKEL